MNILLGIGLVANAYFYEFIAVVIAMKISKKMQKDMNDEGNKSWKVAGLRTIHVVKLIALIWFIPLVMLGICLVAYQELVSFAIMLCFGLVPISLQKIIIPLSERKYVKIQKQVYGKEYQTKY